MIDSAFLQRVINRLSAQATTLDDAEFTLTQGQRAQIKQALTVLAEQEAAATSDAIAADSVANLTQAKVALRRLNERQEKVFNALQRIIKYVTPKYISRIKLPLFRTTILAAVAALAIGCTTSESLLAPYAKVPPTCEEIDEEMQSLAEYDALVYTARGAKVGVAQGVGIAAAAGAIPTGFAWVPLGAALIQPITLPTHEERIDHLAFVRETRGCPPL